jgi:hypothetical protein
MGHAGGEKIKIKIKIRIRRAGRAGAARLNLTRNHNPNLLSSYQLWILYRFDEIHKAIFFLRHKRFLSE